MALIDALKEQSTPPDHILIMDADEARFRKDLIRGYEGIEVYYASAGETLPGQLHNTAAGLSNADILFFFTQNVMPADKRLISKMIRPFHDRMVKAVYARQIPDKKSGIADGCELLLRYPEEGAVHTSEDIPALGFHAFQCSNACAAYDMELFRQIGGFPAPAAYGEASLYAAKLIRRGFKIVYVSNTAIRKTVHGSNAGAFRRSFDLGMSFAVHRDLARGVPFKRLKEEEQRVAEYMSEQRMQSYLPSFRERCRMTRLGFRLGLRWRSLPENAVFRITRRKDFFRYVTDGK